ncbi:type II toxin-antitoxin system Phd/YefM family antitoxin (plasmid) [Paracoccus yeei]|uniref:type II toxin-antitoxin system Phd/YefM family antitoxin n=1 Tax=Paracoccus yeei TaxID=147645 RepID=UPI003BF8D436
MWTLQDAKNRFSAVVDAALAGQPQQVTRRGKPAVVVLAAADYARMLAATQENRGSFAAHLLSFPGPDLGPDSGRARVAPRDVNF